MKRVIKDHILRLLVILGDKFFISLRFYRIFHRRLNWKDPKDLNEKINWLKLNSDTSQWSKLADKYLVRDYVSSLGYEDCLVKLYGKWDDAKDIEWEKLPNRFIMKVNNGSGGALICKNKEELNIAEETQRFDHLMKTKFWNYNGEPHYSRIKPCIIAEELLDVSKQPIKTNTLIDFKIFCFDGKPNFVWCCYNRTKESTEVITYDLDWNRHDEKSVFTSHYKKASMDIPIPKTLNKMLEIAAALSKGFPQVRVDLYEVDEKVYFVEMTFTSSGGYMNFFTQDFLNELGELVDLNSTKN